ncbi:hypothetical protein ABFO19_01465 [Xanthomonas citri pv. glycines]|nr:MULTISPECIES: hypothetical protein [Xanthomonas]QTK34977.1 hypothetical protein XcgCFBP2526_01470 [Xanthomonas citri pv. glycines CFBP 2526]QTK39441.1 hypothetical protein XcgCFBP7119R_01475 [Xanthomonas citri pv. glycines]UIX75337.1 hypothetical protein LMJ37_19005 [Xanthomonas citri pv. glycines]WLA20248.1 hypothetical protein NDK37_01485 [Xanthomonas citri pv. glycines]WLA29739.1 hypothetical protein NPS81_01490 [Xanthomonas citri pv. glycines]
MERGRNGGHAKAGGMARPSLRVRAQRALTALKWKLRDAGGEASPHW